VQCAAFALVPGFAQNEKPAKESKPAGEPPRISADKLLTNAEEKYFEFIGDVKATQADYVITSDSIKIYYEGDLINPKKQSSNKDMFKKIVASGNVEVVSDQYTAKAARMEYDFGTQILILSGENSTITTGKNSIIGSKITLYNADGRIKVEGRVNAEFFSEENVTDIFGKGKSKKESKE
jgi:lipopolysaccharide transport protein LptA